MASEEITNETAEQPVEAAASAPVAETPAAAVSAPEEIKKPEPRRISLRNLVWAAMMTSPKS